MNASVYLQNQGWRGIGHSLDPSDRGLSKPLLVPHKSSKAGLGSKEHDFGNQWWLNAWDGLSDSSPNVCAPASHHRNILTLGGRGPTSNTSPNHQSASLYILSPDIRHCTLAL